MEQQSDHFLLCSSLKGENILGKNHRAEPNQHDLTFLHPILMCGVK